MSYMLCIKLDVLFLERRIKSFIIQKFIIYRLYILTRQPSNHLCQITRILGIQKQHKSARYIRSWHSGLGRGLIVKWWVDRLMATTRLSQCAAPCSWSLLLVRWATWQWLVSWFIGGTPPSVEGFTLFVIREKYYFIVDKPSIRIKNGSHLCFVS